MAYDSLYGEVVAHASFETTLHDHAAGAGWDIASETSLGTAVGKWGGAGLVTTEGSSGGAYLHEQGLLDGHATSDFTIDFWIDVGTLPAGGDFDFIVNYQESGNQELSVFLYQSKLYVRDSLGAELVTPTTYVDSGAFKFVRIIRYFDDPTWKTEVWIDGVSFATGTGGTMAENALAYVTLVNANISVHNFDGVLSDFRFTLGTARTGTEVPTEAFPTAAAAPDTTKWTPAEITTTMWLKPQDAANITLDDDGGIAAILDLSGNGYDAVQATAADAPKYIQGAAEFTAANTRYFTTAHEFADTSAADLDLFIVVNASAVGENALFATRPAAGSTGFSLRKDDAGSVDYYHTGFTTTTQAQGTGKEIVQLYRNGLDIELGYNGTEDGGATLTGFSASTLGHTEIGRENTSSSYLTGQIYEIVAFERTMSASARDMVLGYLAWEHGLEGDLVADHPYEAAAPLLAEPDEDTTLWTPAELSQTIKLWLDASDTASLTIVDDKVSAWVSNDPDARAFSQATAGLRPTINEAIHGYARVPTFSADYLVSDDVNSVWSFLHDGVDEYQVYIAYQPGEVDDPDAAYGLITTCTGGSDVRGFFLSFDDRSSVPRNEVIKYLVGRAQAGNAVVDMPTGDAFHDANTFGVVGLAGDPANGTVGSRGSLRFGGGTALANNTDNGTPSTSDALDTLTIGASGDGTSQLTGRIAEILIVVGAETNRVEIEGYLAWKWGVEPTLATDHNYELRAPTLAPLGVTSLLLLDEANGTTNATDSVPGIDWVMAGGAVMSNAFAKFGTTSLLCVAGDDMRTHDIASFGTGDFTIEGWWTGGTSGATRMIFDMRDAGTTSTAGVLYINSDKLRWFVNGSNVITGLVDVCDGATWFHFAISRVSGVTRMFVDGTQDGSDYADTTNYTVNAEGIVWGNDYTVSAPSLGYLDMLRISDSGLYPTDFTAPTEAFQSVRDPIAAPTIDTQPVADTVTEGEEASYLVAATTSGGTLTYQWYETTAGLISGETAATLDFITVLADDGKGYYCAVTDDNGTTNTDTAGLTVNAIAVDLSIATHPTDQEELVGATATFTVAAADGTGTITYQWYDTTTGLLTGETAATLDFTAAKSDNGKGYYCAVSDDLVTLNSSTAWLTVNLVLTIVTHPAADSVEAPNDATMSVIYTGDGPFTLTWYDPNGVMLGETGDSVTFPAVPWLGGNYYVVIDDATGQSVTSNNALLTVTTPAVVISDPTSITVANRAVARFDVSTSAFGPISHQWYETGVGAIAGETGLTLQFDKVTTVDSARSFYCIATDDYSGTDTSATAILTVVDVTLDDQTTPRATSTPGPQAIPTYRHTDFSGLIRAAKAGEKPYYDTYRFSGRTFQDREE